MPKMKTKKIVRKRFKVTGTGKLLHRSQGRRHLRRKKSQSNKRRQDQMKSVETHAYQVKVMQFIRT